jgi:hypothetical protein
LLGRVHKESNEDNQSAAMSRKWTVWREDDNGRRFIVRTVLTYDEALALVASLEARVHKQFYWLEPTESK